MPRAQKPRPESQDESVRNRPGREKEKEMDKEKGKGKEKEKDKERITQRDPPRSTRSGKLEAHPLSRKGIEALPGQDIASTEEGMLYLESSTLTVPGVPFTIETLVGALF